ncbi:MAG: ABC transporter ATP-binding protein [Bacilli bacterium]|nr:ABC transporter ATP-binding protein [Bacilli bacterium]
MEQQEPIIFVSHLTKDYGYGRGVFDVSLSVTKGMCYGYLGPNGAGKSTTIRHIMGFSKPTTGKVQIFGMDSFGHTDRILGEVGYLPGEPSIPAGLTGKAFLKMMGDMRGMKDGGRSEELLNTFRLDPSPNVKEMSLGDKRKLAIVAAFMHDPEVLVLDEPTSGLDPLMQQVFIRFVVDEKKRGKTILLSSHIFSEVEATCDVISIIKDGKHVSTFDANEVKNIPLKMYVLRFRAPKDYESYLAACPFEVVRTRVERNEVTVKFDQDQYDAFISSVLDYKIDTFAEKPFTLQDYFMSFYKEEKEFGGLQGVVGNKK